MFIYIMILSTILSLLPISNSRKIKLLSSFSSRTSLNNRNLVIISTEMIPYYKHFCDNLLNSTDIIYIEKDKLFDTIFNGLGNYQWNNIAIIFNSKYDPVNNTSTIISRTLPADTTIIELDPGYEEAILLFGKLKMHVKNDIHIFSKMEKIDSIQYILHKADKMFNFKGGISLSSNDENWKLNWNTKLGYLNNNEANISPILKFMSNYTNLDTIKSDIDSEKP